MREKSGKSEDHFYNELNEFHAAIFAWPCVLSDRPPVIWWLSVREGWDAVT